MKGLVEKDLLVLWKTSRIYLFLILLFCAMGCIGEKTSWTFLFYPVLLSGTLAVSAASYDERSRWVRYSTSLPCTRGQAVAAKYLVGLVCTALGYVVMLLGILAAQILHGGLPGEGVWILLTIGPAVAFLLDGVMLPLIFWLGTEKGRVAYIFALIAVSALVGFFVFALASPEGVALPRAAYVLAPLCGAAVYGASWGVSTAIYRRKEL